MMKTVTPSLSTPEFELDVLRSMIRLGTEWFPAMVALVHEEDTMKSPFWGGKNITAGVHLGWCVTVPMENGALIEVVAEMVNGEPALSVYLSVPFWYRDAGNGEILQRYASIIGKKIVADEGRINGNHWGLWANCEPSWVAELILRLRTYKVAPVKDKRMPQKYATLDRCTDFFQEV